MAWARQADGVALGGVGVVPRGRGRKSNSCGSWPLLGRWASGHSGWGECQLLAAEDRATALRQARAARKRHGAEHSRCAAQ